MNKKYSSEELNIQMTLIRDHFDSWAVSKPEQIKELLDDILETNVDLKEVEQFFKENQEYIPEEDIYEEYEY